MRPALRLFPALALLAAPAALGQSPPAAPAPAETGKAEASAPARAAPSPALTAAVAVPRPLAEEMRHTARFDAAIQPLRDSPLAPPDAAHLRAAIAASASGKAAEALALRDKIADAAARKLVDFYLYRGGHGTPAEISAFVASNPAWPDRSLLAQRVEAALLSGASPSEIKGYFASAAPSSALGLGALAYAELADKHEEKAKALAVQAWTQRDMPAALEAAFLKRVGSLLTQADHKRRLDRLLAHTSRLASERNERAAMVRRLLPLFSEGERKIAEARLAVYLGAKNSEQLLEKLAAHAEGDWGLAAQQAHVLRHRKREEEAWNILLAAPNPNDVIKPDGWWEERRSNAYAALKSGKPQTAYALVKDCGPLSVNATKDASFLAGWLALRQLQQPKLALAHFQELAKAADGPLSRARGHYWLGRTYEALGSSRSAQEHYEAASAYFDTFHGQLARLTLNPAASRLKLEPPKPPTPEEIGRFTSSDAVRAAVILRKVGLDAGLVRVFLLHLGAYLTSEAEVAMVAHLAQALGETQTSVRIGKSAIARGMNLIYYAYPIQSLPPYTPLRQPPETAFILGIVRQESEFDQTTLSSAGARGILQVMPVTAKHVCRDYKLKCDIPRLMKDPAYNTMMGSAYISDRMQEFAGSYVLTLAGYNAGPGRAREWIKEFGDPRDDKVDAIDWIHRIPFEETREYVQKVLSNIQIYRARLGDEVHALRLTADLKRLAAPAEKGAPVAAK